ncbi:MAG: TetR/AcrR family transcriptional regulator [Pseudomonadales bacterium]|nr:TetR/AcrR family transcriptional regulator [Pseudomonadales bacterium]
MVSNGPNTRDEILRRAIALFASAGYSGVSMRDVAALVGISAAALYHHFPDKQALYLAAMTQAFESVNASMRAVLESDLPALGRLQEFVERFTELVAGNEHLRLLVQRELLDGDETRLALLAEQVFRELHGAVVALASELDTDLDPYLLANSIIGLVLFSIQSAPLRRHLAAGRARHEQPRTISRHIVMLLTRACSSRSPD